MRYKILRTGIFVVANLLTAFFAEAVQTLDNWKAFAGQTYGYAVRYPKDWNLAPARSPDSFEIINYSPFTYLQSLSFPPGGAKIYIYVPSQLGIGGSYIRTIDDWLEIDRQNEDLIGLRTFDLEGPNGTQSVVELETRCCYGQETVNWYFRRSGQLFRATLLYEQADSKSARHRETFRQIVLSFKFVKIAAIKTLAIKS